MEPDSNNQNEFVSHLVVFSVRLPLPHALSLSSALRDHFHLGLALSYLEIFPDPQTCYNYTQPPSKMIHHEQTTKNPQTTITQFTPRAPPLSLVVIAALNSPPTASHRLCHVLRPPRLRPRLLFLPGRPPLPQPLRIGLERLPLIRLMMEDCIRVEQSTTIPTTSTRRTTARQQTFRSAVRGTRYSSRARKSSLQVMKDTTTTTRETTTQCSPQQNSHENGWIIPCPTSPSPNSATRHPAPASTRIRQRCERQNQT